MSIKHWFKRYFIPHEGNEYKPHLLRSEATVVFLGVILFLEILFFFQTILVSRSSFFAAVLPSVLVQDTNTDRIGDNKQPLAVNKLLGEAAQLKANDMAAKGYFSHNSPDGKTPWYWLEQVGYKYSYAGENLAVNFADSKDIVLAWMNSPTHRANILNKNFSEFGIAAATGTYEGRETIFVVQLFGKPAAVAMNPAPQKPTAKNDQVPPVSTSATGTIAERSQVEGETIALEPATVTSKPSIFTEALTMPHTINKYAFFGLLTLMIFAISLTIFVRIKIQHPHLILNGVLVLAFIGLTSLVNYLLIFYYAQV
jgi:hypothetical protein